MTMHLPKHYLQVAHAIIGLLLIQSLGCQNTTQSSSNIKFVPYNWETVAVTPFTGDSRFTQACQDITIGHLINQPFFSVVQPDAVRMMAKSVMLGASQNQISTLELSKVGELVNASAVISGHVTSYNNGVTLNGFCTLKLVDTASGQIISTHHFPSGKLMGYSEHDCTTAATNRAAKKLLEVLKSLGVKNQRIPIKKEQVASPLGV